MVTVRFALSVMVTDGGVGVGGTGEGVGGTKVAVGRGVGAGIQAANKTVRAKINPKRAYLRSMFLSRIQE